MDLLIEIAEIASLVFGGAFFIGAIACFYVYFRGRHLLGLWKPKNSHKYVQYMERLEFYHAHLNSAIILLLLSGICFLIGWVL